MSELTSFVTIDVDGPVGSIGRPLGFYELRIVDEVGEPLPHGVTGEIEIHALQPGLEFRGYFRNPEATEAASRGEWFRTGDLGRSDAEGNFYFAGRRKDVVRRRGVNISAWEVERVLSQHEAVGECALIGIPSDLGEDDLKLFVRVAEGETLDPLDLIKWCEPRLPYFQVPRYVAFINQFPKTPSERIRKSELSQTTDDCWDLERSGHQIDRKRTTD